MKRFLSPLHMLYYDGVDQQLLNPKAPPTSAAMVKAYQTQELCVLDVAEMVFSIPTLLWYKSFRRTLQVKGSFARLNK